jgi:glycosyltransferase involved in cell wall biosynthesis
MRIVHCFRSPVGGIFRHVRDLVDAQHAAGHEIGIVCDSTTGGDYEAQMFDALGTKVSLGIERTPMQCHVGIGDAAAAWRTLRIIRQMRPDILHGHGAKGGLYARGFGTLMRFTGRRVGRIYSPHGGSLHYPADALSGKVFFLAEKLMDRLTDHLIFVSDYERRTFRLKVGEPHAPNSLVHNGLRESEFVPVAAEAGAADFLYIGMMRDLKGPDLFIDALALATKQAGQRFSGIMVGDGDGLPRYHAQVERLGLAGQVRFTPAMPARQAFALARTVVVPSRAEAMPYIVLEALAARKPMIATSVGGIPEIFGPQSDMLVFPLPAAVAGRMVEAAGDPDGYAGKMPGAREFHGRFSVEAMAEAIDAIYREAVRRKRRRVDAAAVPG